MPQSYCDLLTHFVFSTKDRENLISAELVVRLFSYLGALPERTSVSFCLRAAYRITSTC
jgi:hypothetical protein